MIFTALNVLFFVAVFTGIGLLLPIRIESRISSLFACFWTGWLVAIGILQVFHLFFAVQLGALILLMILSALGWGLRRAGVIAIVRAQDRRTAFLFAALALLPLGMLVNTVLFSAPNSDYALYHLQTVKWFSAYAIVPGLGNLFSPLANNSASFLLSAVLNAGWLAGRGYWLSNTIPAYVLMLQCFAGMLSLLRGEGDRRVAFFWAVMTPVVLLEVSTAYIVAYSPDPLVFFLQIVLGAGILRLFDPSLTREQFLAHAAQMVILFAGGACVKLSFGVFGAAGALAMAGVSVGRFGMIPWRRSKEQPQMGQIRAWLGWLGITAAFLIPWMLRSVIFTGYLAYPNLTVSFPVAWKIPDALALGSYQVIAVWARTVDASIPYTADFVWLARWWNTFPSDTRQAFYFAAALWLAQGAVWAVLRQWGRSRLRMDAGALALALVSGLALAAWFNLAPSFRFAGALFWILLASALLNALRMAESSGLRRADLLALAVVIAVSLWISPNHFSNNLSRKLLWLPPVEYSLPEQARSHAAVTEKQTASGLRVYLPTQGQECWDAPLPCTTTANFSTRLRQLEPGNLQGGFARETR